MPVLPEQQALYDSALLRLTDGYFPPPDAPQAAIPELERALALGPESGKLHALLGYALEWEGRWPEVAEHFRRAFELTPGKTLYEAYYLMALNHVEPTRALADLEQVALRRGVDLDALREENHKQGLGDSQQWLIIGTFGCYARNFLRSELEREAEPIRDRLAGVDPAQLRRRELAAYRRMQKDLAASFHLENVPADIRELADDVIRLGIGDDLGRQYLFSRLKKKELEALIAHADSRAPQVHAWLDSFGSGAMSDEAAAYMYLMLGIEEERPR